MSEEIPTEHPHVVRIAGNLGGAPVIRGTQIAVRLIAVMWKAGDTVEDIVRTYPHLRASWIHDAISYYLDHQPEIEAELKDNEIENAVARYSGKIDDAGNVHFGSG